MGSKVETVNVVIADQAACRIATALSEDAAVTLIAVASEDPSCWNDMDACWDRYRTPVVPMDLADLAFRRTEVPAARHELAQHHAWVVIDLTQKQILTGKDIETVGRRAFMALFEDDNVEQQYPLSVSLPDWWELHEQTELGNWGRGRVEPIVAPKTNREVLYGQAMVRDLALRVLQAVGSEAWIAQNASSDEQARYQFTVQVHRDWLMNPREDLGGQIPRQLLHGARDWVNDLATAQRSRYEAGLEMVALPIEFTGYEDAPMGLEELCCYFDLCRALIDAAWPWCLEQGLDRFPLTDRMSHQPQLAIDLVRLQEYWLDSPFEGGSTPRFIIECCRRRVPCGDGISISGMTDYDSSASAEENAEEHAGDCDCPICDMLAEGMMGPAFFGFDGHHLELDDEFAFSIYETYEEWELERQPPDDMLFAEDDEEDENDEEVAEDEVETDANLASEPDPFAPIWRFGGSDQPIPGDSAGHMQLAFLLAEVVGILEENTDSSQDIKRLNSAFRAFRRAASWELSATAETLGQCLAELGEKYPSLVSRMADLQSRIDEHLRSKTTP